MKIFVIPMLAAMACISLAAIGAQPSPVPPANEQASDKPPQKRGPVDDKAAALKIALEHYKSKIDAKGAKGEPETVWKNAQRDEWVVLWEAMAVIVNAKTGEAHHYVPDRGTD